jgi:hypothetical protein
VGEWDHPSYGHRKITEMDLAEFVRNFEAGIRKDLPIKEGHEVLNEKPAIGRIGSLQGISPAAATARLWPACADGRCARRGQRPQHAARTGVA